MHQNKPNTYQLATQVTKAFAAAGFSVQAEPWLEPHMNEANHPIVFTPNPVDAEAVISLGGDGTILRASQLALSLGVPLLGINIGRVGFLAEIELEQLSTACVRLRQDAYQLETRMLLHTALENKPLPLALNDVVISRGGYSRLIAVKAWVDQELVGRYVGDGVIASTPTGSTGYSLSAGGPIVFPDVDCVLLSPICAHSLQHRPVVLSAKQTLRLELDCDVAQQAQLSIDGQESAYLQGKQHITIQRSEKQASFIRLEPQHFFQLIRHKLSEWTC